MEQLAVFLVLLALGERATWRDKVCALWPESGPTRWVAAVKTLTERLRRFQEGLEQPALDLPEAYVRLRLNATAVRAVNRTLEPGREGVEVDYVTEEGTFRVRARHAILACNNRMVPYLCPQLPEAQAAANLSDMARQLAHVVERFTY